MIRCEQRSQNKRRGDYKEREGSGRRIEEPLQSRAE